MVFTNHAQATFATRRTVRSWRALCLILRAISMMALAAAGRAEETSAANAAATAKSNGGGLEDIVVTASKRETRLMDTPIAITAVSQGALDNAHIVNVRGLKALVPNLQIGTLPDSGTSITLRGVGSIDPTEVGEASVALHQDGFYSPRSQGALALIYDVERVEVLRGPQGTLFGQNSPGGTVNIIPNKPEFNERSGSADLATGTGYDRAIRGIINWSFSDSFAVRITGTYERRDGLLQQLQDYTAISYPAYNIVPNGIPSVDQRYNVHVSPANYYNNINQLGVRIAARWKPFESLELSTKYSIFSDQGAGDIDYVDCEQAAGTINACDHPLRWARINVPGYKDMYIHDFQTKIAYDVSDHVVVEIRNNEQIQTRRQREDIDGGAHPAAQWSVFGDPRQIRPNDVNSYCQAQPDPSNPGAFPAVYVANGCYYPLADTFNSTDSSRYFSMGNEVQIKSKGSTRLQYVFGGFFFHEDKRIRYSVVTPENRSWTPYDPAIPGSGLDGLPLLTVYDQHKRTTTDLAVFGNLDFKLTDKIGMTVGYRHSWDQKRDINGYTLGYFSTGDPYLTSADGTNLLYNGYVPAPGSVLAHQSNNLGPGSIEGVNYARLPILTGPSNRTKSWSQGIYKFGMQYHLDEDRMIYVSYSTGYKMGGFYEDYDTCNNGCFQHQEYNPEYVNSYELGYKAKLFDNRLQLSIDGFWAAYKDIQVTGSFVVGANQNPAYGPLGTPVQQYTTKNIANARIRGIEVEFGANPWTGASLTGFATYTEAVIVKSGAFVDGYACFERQAYGQTPCGGSTPDFFRGNTLPFVPKFSITLNYEQRFELPNGWALAPHLGNHYQSMMFLDIQNYAGAHLSQTQAGYFKIEGGLKLASPEEKYYVDLSADNITNIDTKSADGFQYGRLRGYYDPPRTWSLRVGAKF